MNLKTSTGPRPRAAALVSIIARANSQGYLSNFDYHSLAENSLLKKHSQKTGHRDLYSGLIRLHVLYHASKEPIFGLEMMEELARHGYRLSSGTMYPLLHGLESKGLLRSSRAGLRPNSRLEYRATAAGRSALAIAKIKVRELFSELFQDVMNGASSSKRRKRS
jgi:PadR family transcriptional regulator, regulatory protein PadR